MVSTITRLKQGFKDELQLILNQIRPDRQVLMFSATWPEDLRNLAQEVCKDYSPIHICIGSTKLAACKDIDQTFWFVGHENQPGARRVS